MDLKGGYNGKLVVVNLESRKSVIEELNPNYAHDFLGGRGYGVKLLWDNWSSTSNFFGAFVGPLTGTGVPLANRLTFVFHSPLTNTVAFANTGGYAGTALKRTGFDGLVLVGESESPVYVLVKRNCATVEDAKSLWGRNVSEVTAALRAKHGDARVLAIGPAGEAQVKFANVLNDAGRTSGVRHGAGCVLGKMKVKAVAIVGDYTQTLPIADKLAFREVLTRLNGKLRSSPLLNRDTGTFAVYGTPLAVEPLAINRALPTRNYTSTELEGWQNLTGKKMKDTILVGRLTCTACSVQCRRETATHSKYEFRVEGPDYAQVSALGSNCQVIDLEAVAYMNYLCYELGLDPIEVGNLLAILAEATEKGIVPKESGLKWGDEERMIQIIRELGEGKGDLREGAEKLTEKLGDPSLTTAVCGITIQNTDPRAEPAWGLLNATDNTGASCHIWVYPDLIYSFRSVEGVRTILPEDRGDLENIARAVKFKQDLVAALDSLQVCAFSYMAFDLEDYVQALKAVAGVEIESKDLLKVGERIFNLERLYDLRAGGKRDYLPEKFRNPLPDGRICHLDEMISKYYAERVWNGGIPEEEKLKDLGLSS
ncbi:aldehyde ferredoxin oxidoreductase [Sulfodiicoccus acidiphilus]|uniref:Aldehyde ferredoxin oxidoreductase n=1 Tax=Sulfodiicoccus acidiphilus TaxID=1670455 RepID=A0A348B237_9CREN|nr:aldehyde ferredoxin oxidoreductase family protein [Sulfodiicoccus acidiphilus]BBD72239.1 aldehyde ferredoxin oxidoreductase [Sulfodiicoccus acidiphilus]GGT90863.1 aldehyde ferredoxin oxidoreductase [Sulfodiicoccus acidiphilus]